MFLLPFDIQSPFLRLIHSFEFARKTFRYKRFVFLGKKYSYFCHRYNATWKNERAVEVPIAWRFLHIQLRKKLLQTASKPWRDTIESKEFSFSVLEVGNVLSHYFPLSNLQEGAKKCGFLNYTVLDKYEKAGHVINEDVIEYSPRTKFDYICGISTLEHVGYDEDAPDRFKTLKALHTLKGLLNPGGRLLVTFPLGYNPNLDVLLKSGFFGFTRTYFLQRTTHLNAWRQVRYKDVSKAKYNQPFNNANAVCVAWFDA